MNDEFGSVWSLFWSTNNLNNDLLLAFCELCYMRCTILLIVGERPYEVV